MKKNVCMIRIYENNEQNVLKLKLPYILLHLELFYFKHFNFYLTFNLPGSW